MTLPAADRRENQRLPGSAQPGSRRPPWAGLICSCWRPKQPGG